MSKVEPFGDKDIRYTWCDENQCWYFVITEVIGALTDSTDPFHTTKRLRRDNKELAAIWKEIWTPIDYFTVGGYQQINSATALGLMRIVCCMQSSRVRLLRNWLQGLSLKPTKNDRSLRLSKSQYQDFYHILADPKDWKKRKRLFLQINEDLPEYMEMNDLELIFALLKLNDFKTI